MKKISLKLKFILFFILISCAVWGCAGVMAWSETKEKIDEFFDTYQMAMARQLAGTNWSGISSDTQKRTDEIFDDIRGADDEDEAIGFAVFDASGRRIFHDDENGKHFAYQDVNGSFVKQRVNGENWRLIWIKSTDGKFRIAVGQELEYREDMAWDMLEEFMMPWAVGLLVLLLVVIGGISFELQSLKHLTNDIAMRKADDLTPISDKNIPLEISPLTQALNNLLERVNSVLQRERRFISDAAHELRTPLTALKVQLDVARISMDDSAVHKAALNKLDEGIERSIRLVEQLLSLSRVEASFQKNQKIYEVINWKLICEQMLNEYQSDISAKKLVIKITGNGAGVFDKGNSSLAELIVRNLLDNAIKYSPQGADIEIVIGLNYLEVRNTGVNIAPQDLNKLDERFFRIAGQNEKGNGIGLSIVKCIADFYACNLIFTNIENVFCARIEKK